MRSSHLKDASTRKGIPMVGKTLITRAAQAASILVLGFSLHVSGAVCAACPGPCQDDQSCTGWRPCEQCPASWYGSCVAGVEGCGYYDCDDDGYCCELASSCQNFCYCPECEGGRE